jgi:RpiR family transcriptional regulator, carbohydrate utilization regulator
MPDESQLDAPREVLARVRAYLPGLQAADARVARVVVDQPEAVIYRSAAEVGELAGTSAATVVRCAQKLGFKGFHDLKLALAQELPAFPRDGRPAPAADPRLAALAQVTRAGAEAVRDAGALVDPASFAAAVTAIGDASSVLFVGVGTSAPLCQDAAYRFSAIGIRAEAPADPHVQHVRARQLAAGDVCVAVSHTGSTHETLQAARGAAQAAATVVAITSFARSALTEDADCVIVAGARELGLRLEAVASRLAHLAVLDALLVALADRDRERSQAALAIYADVLTEHRL